MDPIIGRWRRANARIPNLYIWGVVLRRQKHQTPERIETSRLRRFVPKPDAVELKRTAAACLLPFPKPLGRSVTGEIHGCRPDSEGITDVAVACPRASGSRSEREKEIGMAWLVGCEAFIRLTSRIPSSETRCRVVNEWLSSRHGLSSEGGGKPQWEDGASMGSRALRN